MTAVREGRNLDDLLESSKGILLNVGVKDKQPGFLAMDRHPGEDVDIVHDWNEFPWPLPDNCVHTIWAYHVVEKISPANGHFIEWMNECWRILKPNRQLAINTPYAGSRLYWADPTNINGCNESTWFYFMPDHESQAYTAYRPKPWKIELNLFHGEGNLEVVLRKLEENDEI